MRLIVQLKKDIFIMGDSNVNIHKKGSNESKELLNMMSSYGLKQYINEPTRLSNNSCIDLLFTNCDYISRSGTLNLNYSDHQAIFITKKKQKQKSEKITFEGRSYKNYNKEQFQYDLQLINWNDFFETQDPEIAWSFLIGKIIDC